MIGQAETLIEQRLLEIQKAELDFAKRHRLYYYQPKGEQVRFHDCKCHVRVGQGKNRSGKTTAGVVEDVCFALGFRPYLLPIELKSKGISWLLDHPNLIPESARTPIHRAVKVLIVEDDWDVVDEILVIGTEAKPAKLPFYIPTDAIIGRPIKNSLGHVCQYNVRSLYGGHSIIRMDTEKSFKNDPGSFEGTNADVVHWDEPKCKAMRAAVKRGLVDEYGWEWFTFTALGEGWMKNNLYDKAGINPEIAAFNFDTDDLIKEGIVSKKGWDEYAESLDEDEKEARIHGRWAHLSGLVYKGFVARDVKDGGHITDPLPIEWVHEHSTGFLAIDPHPRNPLAALILICDERQRWIVWEELYEKSLIEEFCLKLDTKLGFMGKDSKGKEEMKRVLIAAQIMDPLAFIEDPVDKSVWADEFDLHGYVCEPATKDKARGIMNIKAALKSTNKDTWSPQLVFCRNCVRTIWEIQNYVYGDWATGTSHTHDPKERPVDKDDHMMENLYRLVNLKPFHIPQADRNPIIKPRDLCPAL